MRFRNTGKKKRPICSYYKQHRDGLVIYCVAYKRDWVYVICEWPLNTLCSIFFDNLIRLLKLAFRTYIKLGEKSHPHSLLIKTTQKSHLNVIYTYIYRFKYHFCILNGYEARSINVFCKQTADWYKLMSTTISQSFIKIGSKTKKFLLIGHFL